MNSFHPGGGSGSKRRYKKRKYKKRIIKKTSLHLKYKEGKQFHYWVSAFPSNFIEAGFEEKILHDFSSLISELHDFDQHNHLKCFSLIIPENKHDLFFSWLKNSLNLDFQIKN